MQPAQVKPLHWQSSQFVNTSASAMTILGLYVAWTHHEQNGHWFWRLSGGARQASGVARTEEEAKAAAETDYQQCVTSCLQS